LAPLLHRFLPSANPFIDPVDADLSLLHSTSHWRIQSHQLPSARWECLYCMLLWVSLGLFSHADFHDLMLLAGGLGTMDVDSDVNKHGQNPGL
jgi:hypothetical protein